MRVINDIIYCCMDCGNLITCHTALKGMGRCKSCASSGKNNPNYKNGKTCEQYFCIDCRKEISSGLALRCMSCNKKGVRHRSYIDGRTLKICFCIDCGIQLSRKNYKLLRCFSCSLSYQHKTGIRNIKGDNNPNWEDGISKHGHPFYFNEELKEAIRTRDNFTCQGCGKTEIEENINLNQNLSVHHINYNKLDCSFYNLITTCQSCNSKANFNRNYWTIFYSNKIKENNVTSNFNPNL